VVGLQERHHVGPTDDRVLRGADLRRALGRLAHADRLVVVLFFYLDLPLHEVAAVTCVSVPAARARLYRAIRRLRPDLEVEEALQ
jgi:DNA-directed RNA polymerase specialized sigma24 family protein